MTIAVTLSGSRPSDRLQLSVVAVGLGEALAVAAGAAAARTGEWAVAAALGRVADGAAFAFAAAWGDRLACGRADVGAAARADLIMVDAVESTPMPAQMRPHVTDRLRLVCRKYQRKG